jgi:hypothetical protein
MARNSGRLSVLVGAIFAFWSTLPAPAPAQTVSFTATELTVGANPRSVAVGDFNGDGKRDLAVVVGYSSVSVLLGNADGTFQAAPDVGVGVCPLCRGARLVAVGDFNADGVQDLAVQTGHFVEVVLGNGDGTFQAPSVSFGFFEAPQSLAVGDFNGDGVQDLAVADFVRGVFVGIGNGDGTFTSAPKFFAGIHPWSLAVGDFNGDGAADLAVGDLASTTVRVLLSNGDGTFQAARSFNVGSIVAAGDFNGDGALDLVTGFGKSSVLLGNGDGTFQAAQPLDAGTGFPSVIAVGDFNRDRVPDLAVANAGSNNVSVLLGNGDGTFQAAQSFGVGTAPVVIAVGEFNAPVPRGLAVHRKEAQDLVVTNSGSDSISVLINDTPRGAPNGPVD